MIVLLAILSRSAVFVLTELKPALFDFPDSHRYVQVARNIAEGAGPIDHENLRSGTDPIYPLLLSIAPTLGYDDDATIFRWGRIINIAASMATLLLLSGLTRRLISPRAALCSSFIFAIDPILLFFNGLVLTEALYILLFVAAYYFLTLALTPIAPPIQQSNDDPSPSQLPGKIQSRQPPSPVSWALAAGICLGLGTLTRSTNLFFPVFLLPALLFLARRAESKMPLQIVTAMLLATLFTLSPALIRNFRIYHRLVPARVGGGASLLEGLGPWADGAPGMDRILYPATPPDANELERDDIYRRKALNWASEHPTETAALALRKLARTWSIEMNASGYGGGAYRWICWMTVAPEFLLAMAGFWLLRKRRALLAFLLAPAVYFTLIHMIFVGSVRYRLPAMPLLFVLCAAALDHWISSRKRGQVA